MAIDEKKLTKDLYKWFSGKRAYCTNHGFYDLLNDFEDCFDDFADIIDEQPKLSLETKTSDKWIPCSKDLPPKPEDVTRQEYIVQAKRVIEPYIASWDGEKWFYDEFGGYEVEEGNILAWMPLPEAYKGNE